MKTLKIKFDRLWQDFNPVDNYFTRILSKRYNVVISEEPDFYFFSHSYFGQDNYLHYKCHRIFLGWENRRADWNICDYVLDSDFLTDNPRHKRFPIWASFGVHQLTKPKDLSSFLVDKKFCCMVVSNGKAKERIDFFDRLSAYKKVDSGGRYLNNIGGPVVDKKEFIKAYKFVIAFENSSYPGYTTEKLFEPMYSNTIPIYWGNKEVGKDFNVKSFVNVNDYESFDAAIDHIIELDNNDEAYMAMAAQPWLNNNNSSPEFSEESLLSFFDYIVEDSKTKIPVALSFYKRNLNQVSIIKRKMVHAIRKKIIKRISSLL